MKRHSILILSVALLIGAPNASAQSFLKDKLRKVTSKIEKGVSKKIPKKVKDAAKNVEGVTNDIKGVANDVQSATSVVKGKAINVNHTALFAPMGDPVDPSHGTCRNRHKTKQSSLIGMIRMNLENPSNSITKALLRIIK